MNISPLSKMMQPLYKYGGKASEWSLKTPLLNLQKSLDMGAKDPAKFAAQMLVTSIVSKDLVGCVLYTTQSWNNKQIPADKRKFVGAVDLMNGIVMVGGQFIIGKIIDNKITPKFISKHITGIDANKQTSNSKALLASDNLLDLTKKALKKNKEALEKQGIDIESKEAINHYSKLVIKELGDGSKHTEMYKKGLGIFIAAIATTALTKRTLAPLISTPMASWFDKKFLSKNKKGQVAQNTVVAEKPANPSVKEVKVETKAPQTQVIKNNEEQKPKAFASFSK